MHRYLAFRYRQTPDAKPILAFVAPAEEIRTWGGVPHKTTDFIGGFQRPLSERFKQIIKFFDEQANSSPTAIVVALRPGAAKVTPLLLPAGVVATGLSYTPEWCYVELVDESGSKTLKDLSAQLYGLIKDRIASDSPIDDAASDEEAEGDADGANEEDLPPEGAATDEWGVDVGSGALKEFADRIRTAEEVDKFLATIAAGISDAELDEQGIPAEAEARQKARTELAERRLREVLESLLKPAMIVDGQHRVWGAAESENEIPFAVCALEDADWRDQVFQFVVINRQARAISSELLASIVNSSLTNREIRDLEDQLESAGIPTYETRILRIMNDDPDSPFQGLVSRGLEESSKKITFKAAIALANRWNKKMTDRDKIYKALFRQALPGASNPEKQEAWRGLWKNYMFAFWNAIKNLYLAEQLWEPGSQLLYRATMEVMQDNFLTAKAVAGTEYSDPVAFRESVSEFYKAVPAGFFQKEWKRKELLTDDGRKVLADALNAMRVPGAKLATLVKTDPLFTGSPPKKK